MNLFKNMHAGYNDTLTPQWRERWLIWSKDDINLQRKVQWQSFICTVLNSHFPRSLFICSSNAVRGNRPMEIHQLADLRNPVAKTQNSQYRQGKEQRQSDSHAQPSTRRRAASVCFHQVIQGKRESVRTVTKHISQSARMNQYHLWQFAPESSVLPLFWECHECSIALLLLIHPLPCSPLSGQ